MNTIPLSGYNRSIKIDVNAISNKDIVRLSNLNSAYEKVLLEWENGSCKDDNLYNKLEMIKNQLLVIFKRYSI